MGDRKVATEARVDPNCRYALKMNIATQSIRTHFAVEMGKTRGSAKSYGSGIPSRLRFASSHAARISDAEEKRIFVNGDSCNLTKTCDRYLLGASEEWQAQPASARRWREQAHRLKKEAHALYFVFRHPNTHWFARLVAGCTAAYLFSPVQIIPNYIPVIGVMDDVLVVFLGVKLLRRITPDQVLAECRSLADAADVRGRKRIRSFGAVAAYITIATVWLLAGVIATVLMAVYVRH
jgi:uncharacterized membrane protein YkvA (DUF1232 family)